MKLLSFYLAVILTFTVLYICSFHSALFSSQTVLFYRGLELMTVIGFVVLGAFFLGNQKWLKLSLETLLAAVLVSISINLCIFIVFPVTFDRSVTMFLLSTLQGEQTASCAGVNRTDLEQILIERYVIAQKAVERRIFEQKQIDLVQEQQGCIALTGKGQAFMDFSEWVKKAYAIETH